MEKHGWPMEPGDLEGRGPREKKTPFGTTSFQKERRKK
jgi:hypothetical protein